MDKLWIDEELVPVTDSENTLESVNRPMASNNGIMRIHHPQWGIYSNNTMAILSVNSSKFLLVKFGFEFALKDNDSRSVFTFARCETYIRSANKIVQPIVLDIFPKDVYDGEQKKITLKLGPEISLGDYGGSLGGIGTDVSVGQITPSVVGWKGINEQTPYWELRPIKKSLLGIQNFWAVIECPVNCNEIRISARAEAHLQTHFGPIAIGPKEYAWENRPSTNIKLQ